MHSPLCGIPVRVDPHVVIVAMVYAIIFATTTCGLAVRSYIHIFGGLGPPTAISLAVILTWYALDAASWVFPLANGIQLYLHALVREGRSASFATAREAVLVSPAPVLMCATPRFLAISILVGEAILWWRVCVGWKGNRAVVGLCAVVLFVTTVLVGVTIGRLEIMKSPPVRLAVVFFVEPDGMATAALVLVSGLVSSMLLDLKTRTGGLMQKMTGRRGPRGRKTTTMLRKVRDLALWALVAATAVGAFWLIAAAYRRRIWTTIRNDAPSWSFWNFTLFVATASCIRVPALVWLLPQSFKATTGNADADAGVQCVRSGPWPEEDSDDGFSDVEMQERVGRPSSSELVFAYDSSESESDAEPQSAQEVPIP